MGQTEKMMHRVAGDIREALFELQLELTGSDSRNYPNMSRDELVNAVSGGVAFLKGIQRGTLTMEQMAKLLPCGNYAD